MSKLWIAILLIYPLLAVAKDSPKPALKPAECTLESVPGWPMKYCDLVPGTGAAAANGDKLSVTYVGWLADGTWFESSDNPRKPYKFELGARKVIKGWDVGLEGMRVGGRRQLRIPQSMAYGMSAHGSIPPNADLIFEVELLDIKSK
jgi:FKBP-type peptidyl-prolyl cis-trans isomerase